MTWEDFSFCMLIGWALPTAVLLLFYLWYGRTRGEGYHVAYRSRDILRCAIPFVNIFAAGFAIIIALGDFFLWLDGVLYRHLKDNEGFQWWNRKLSNFIKDFIGNE